MASSTTDTTTTTTTSTTPMTVLDSTTDIRDKTTTTNTTRKPTTSIISHSRSRSISRSRSRSHPRDLLVMHPPQQDNSSSSSSLQQQQQRTKTEQRAKDEDGDDTMHMTTSTTITPTLSNIIPTTTTSSSSNTTTTTSIVPSSNTNTNNNNNNNNNNNSISSNKQESINNNNNNSSDSHALTEDRLRSSSLTRPPKLPNGRRHDEVFNPRKLFVGNLTRNMTNNRFRDYWEKFGTLEDCIVIKEPMSNENRGFGFVVFAEQAASDRVLQIADTLEIDGRKLDIRKAVPRASGRYRGGQGLDALPHTGTEAGDTTEAQAGTQGHLEHSYGFAHSNRGMRPPIRPFNKLFVGALPDSVTADQLTDVFKKFGNIIDSVVMYDADGLSRRFGFVTFEDPRNCDRVLQAGPHYIGGTKLAIERAVPKRDMEMYQMEEDAMTNMNYYGSSNPYYGSSTRGMRMTVPVYPNNGVAMHTYGSGSLVGQSSTPLRSSPMVPGTMIGAGGMYGTADATSYYRPGYYDMFVLPSVAGAHGVVANPPTTGDFRTRLQVGSTQNPNVANKGSSTEKPTGYGPYHAPAQGYRVDFVPY